MNFDRRTDFILLEEIEEKGMKISLLILVMSLIASFPLLAIANDSENGIDSTQTKLAVLGTSGDPMVAHKVCFMYTHAAKKNHWFDRVVLIIWGPSSNLLPHDKSLQEKVKAMQQDGVETVACKACADSYGVSDDLMELGVNVKYMGKPLTEMLQSDWKVLTF